MHHDPDAESRIMIPTLNLCRALHELATKLAAQIPELDAEAAAATAARGLQTRGESAAAAGRMELAMTVRCG